MNPLRHGVQITPNTVFVRFIPNHTSSDELKTLFEQCGKVTFVNIVTKKLEKEFANHKQYLRGFIKYENQQQADNAITTLDGKIFKNQRGIIGKIQLSHALQDYKDNKKYDQYSNQVDIQTDMSKEEELFQRYLANQEKLKQIYHDPAIEQEINDLRCMVSQLQTEKADLESKVEASNGEIDILKLQLKLQKLNMEQERLKQGA